MGASICYQPVRGVYLAIGAPSSFLGALERLTGSRGPWTFTDRDSSQLQALAAGLDSADQRDAANELADKAYQFGEIRVWAEY